MIHKLFIRFYGLAECAFIDGIINGPYLFHIQSLTPEFSASEICKVHKRPSLIFNDYDCDIKTLIYF